MKIKTLVIHIEDPSTDFLEDIYIDKYWDFIDYDYFPEQDLKEIISRYDRIVMLGHGSPSGLFGNRGYIIDDSFGPLLKTKETVCIWCNADKFVERHGLKGFYTGMFISEVQEAKMCGIHTATQESIDYSNELFAELLGDLIFIEDDILTEMKERYWVDNDEVVNYNNKRLYENR